MRHLQTTAAKPKSVRDSWAHLWSSVPAAALLLTTIVLLGGCGEADAPSVSTADSATTAEAGMIEQTADERTYDDWVLEEVPLEESSSIGRLALLRIPGDQLFVLDGAYWNVKRYGLNGELEAVYGNGRGQGPGEFQTPTSFSVTGKEAVWIADPNAREVSRFRYDDGTFVESFHTEFPPMRVAAVGEDRLAVQTFAQPKLFALVNEKGEVQKRFGNLRDDLHMSSFDAHVFPRPSGGFVWAPRYASYLFFYDENAELDRRMELIDDHSFPQTDSGPGGPAPDDRPQKTLNVSVTAEAIFVTTLLRNQEPTVSVLDRYDRDSGKYLDSVRLPSDGYHYVVHDGTIYGEVADTTLQAYRIRR